MISAIVAVDNNWGIGYNNDLLMKIPNDLKHFKKITNNNIIIMGSNTWESLPVKPLPNRVNIVISRKPYQEFMEQGKFKGYYDAIVCTLDEVKSYLKTYGAFNEIFIIGGEFIYKELLPYCDLVYLTKINKSFENVDKYFPTLDDSWTSTLIGEEEWYDGISYQFYLYTKN